MINTDNYTFCKKDGSIKKRYVYVCLNITSANIEHRTITSGRQSVIVDEYDCWVIPTVELYTKEKRDYLLKVEGICNIFDVKIRPWYSYNEVTIELLGKNVSYMIETLNKLLRGDNYIR